MNDFKAEHWLAIVLAFFLGMLTPMLIIFGNYDNSDNHAKPRRGTGAIATPIGDEQQ